MIDNELLSNSLHNITNKSCQHLYFTSPSVTEDLKFTVLICDEDSNPNLFCINNNTKQVKKISNSKGLLRTYTYPNGDLNLGFSKTSPILDSKKSIVYWIQNHKVYSYDLKKENLYSNLSKKFNYHTCSHNLIFGK